MFFIIAKMFHLKYFTLQILFNDYSIDTVDNISYKNALTIIDDNFQKNDDITYLELMFNNDNHDTTILSSWFQTYFVILDSEY